MRTILLAVTLVVPSFVFAAVSHPDSGTVAACYTDHDDVHFFPVGGTCNDDYDYGYVFNRTGEDCQFFNDLEEEAPAQVINAGGNHCLVEDNAGNLWSVEKGVDSDAGIAGCISAGDFSTDAGCVAGSAPPASASAKPVPTFGPAGLIALIMAIVLLGYSGLAVRK